MYRNFKIVPNIIFGRGPSTSSATSSNPGGSRPGAHGLRARRRAPRPGAGRPAAAEQGDLLLPVSLVDEPKTSYIDQLVARIRTERSVLPDGIIGLGGGGAMDIAKAISLLLTNPGSAADYQGWDLIKNPPCTTRPCPPWPAPARRSRAPPCSPGRRRSSASTPTTPCSTSPARPGTARRRAQGPVVLHRHGLATSMTSRA